MTLNTGRLIRKGANASIDKMACALSFLSWRSGQVSEPFSVDTRGEEESICCSAPFALGDKLIG